MCGSMASEEEIKEIDSQWQELHSELVKRCVNSLDVYSISKIAKLPYKVINLLQPMTWRMRDTEEAARKLIDMNYVHPAAILIRSAMENAAFVFVLLSIVKEDVVAGEISKDTDRRIMDMSFGNQYRQGEYVPDDVYESMHEHKAIRTYEIMTEIEKIHPGYYGFYKNLCEFVHTNTDGVQGSFSLLDEKRHITYYGKMLTRNNEIYPAIESSIVVALSIYKECFDKIVGLMPQFISLSENDIRNRRKMRYECIVNKLI